MTPSRDPHATSAAVAGHLGARIREERRRRRWTLRQLGARAQLSTSQVHWLEAGNRGSLDAYVAVARALGLRAEFDLVDARRRPSRTEDPVHAAMCEVLAARFAREGVGIGLDEPYQHYQFAGRADVLAWSIATRALLHVECRTAFPNLQDALGSYNAKRRWLAASVAERLGLRGGWTSTTHVLVGLWSSDVLHALRIRPASFRAVCPDPVDPFARWWVGDPPIPGTWSTLVVLDPLAGGRSDRRRFVGPEDAFRVRPRYRDYADAASALRSRGAA